MHTQKDTSNLRFSFTFYLHTELTTHETHNTRLKAASTCRVCERRNVGRKKRRHTKLSTQKCTQWKTTQHKLPMCEWRKGRNMECFFTLLTFSYSLSSFSTHVQCTSNDLSAIQCVFQITLFVFKSMLESVPKRCNEF